MCVRVFSVGFGTGFDAMSPARSRRSASHAAGTHGWLPQKTGLPGLRRGGVGGYNLHSVPPDSPPDCGTVAHQPRAGCIRLVRCSSGDLVVHLLQGRRGWISRSEVVSCSHLFQYFCWNWFRINTVSSRGYMSRCCF